MRVVAIILLLLAVAGCSRGPDSAAVTRNINQRLATALPQGVVELVTLKRRGSQSDTKAPAGESRRIVYFDVELRLQKDFDFGAWEAPGMAGLVSALGAGPKGIAGVKAGGNRAGDVIRAHGTALYKWQENEWVNLVSAGFRPSDPPTYATNAPQSGTAASLREITDTIESLPGELNPVQARVIEEELAATQIRIRARLARAADGYAIAAGPEHGQYLRFVRALSGTADLRIEPLITPGGEENLMLLRGGKVLLALSQGDAAFDAFQGRGRFEAEGPHSGLRAIGSLYPEPVHVIVRAGSTLRSAADLVGRRVAIGEHGSASRTTALRVLEAHGLGLEDIRPLELSFGAALARLRSEEIDAVVQVIGVPADAIRAAIATGPLRLLPLAPDAIRRLVEKKSGYFDFTIVRGTYANQSENVRTIATAALLLVSDDLADTEIAALTRAVFEGGRDFAARGSSQGSQVSAATATERLPIPQHVVANKILAEMN